ncbi:MAG: 16S rRNA (cytosine(1402)-N(4))-methyltransferase RsmH [Acidimicrobiaceae bacterium]|nr:16S rRNA (cytosine(1402)-N(4))-methyltransferase RsmH [Acidimicrobiaceae bacterium]
MSTEDRLGIEDLVGSSGHQPAMLDEVVAVLSRVPDGVVVDATLGAGGHAEALLNANRGLSLVGIDRDPDALSAAGARLAPQRPRAALVHCRFDEMEATLRKLDVQRISGCLFDLGVSSMQLDTAERGFSYRHCGPLDMRMDRSRGITGADVVNSYDQGALAALLRQHGDEPDAHRIARAIVAARPITSTVELAEVVRGAVPAAVRRSRGHPARRTFQAIRVEVNEELRILEDAIKQALALLAPRGRCAVLAYHSGEDRIVKRCFNEASGQVPPPRPGLPAQPRPASVRLLWRGARRPGAQETDRNPRARAARLRAVERLREER